jgi:hypothetical protein
MVRETTGPPIVSPRPVSPHRLSAAVLDAARAWAALVWTSTEPIDVSTEEGQLRLALMDAVHDLEYAETNSAAYPLGMRPLFDQD